MRIVVIGEFSSFAKNLIEGLTKNGHSCYHFTWGDGYRKIGLSGEGYQIKNYRSLRTLCKSVIERMKLRRHVKKMSKEKKYDVVLVLSPSFIHRKYFFWDTRFTKNMILSLVKDPNNIFLSGCGNDIVFYDYWIHQNSKNKKMIELLTDNFTSKRQVRLHSYYSSFINKIIPVMYDYAEAWRNSPLAKNFTICPTIPMPINTESYVKENNVTDKIVIFHGLTRPEYKGTLYIKEAMERIEKNFKDKVECRIEGHLPLVEYTKLLSRTNIVIDQTFAHSYGMNGLISLAMGKVLLSGNTRGNKEEFKSESIPVINIEPDSNQIYSELEKLVNNPSLIETISEQSRKYVENFHDADVVAKQYISLFQDYCKIE